MQGFISERLEAKEGIGAEYVYRAEKETVCLMTYLGCE
jgi:hypothetical protein